MERRLGWDELQRIVTAHEDLYNYQALKNFCNRYYPNATRVVIEPTQEYNDNDYTFSAGPNEITVWQDDTVLTLAADDIELLVLLGQSPELKAQLAEDKPENPVIWLADVYYDDVYSLELFGTEKGHIVEVNFTDCPPRPTTVYIKEEACLTF